MALRASFLEDLFPQMARPSFSFPLLLCLWITLAACSGGALVTEEDADDASESSDPIVAAYADTALTLSAFERAYTEENQPSDLETDSLPARKEFLEQYVHFRLKLRAAREAGMDTLSGVKREVASYRQKMARPILMESEIYKPLIRTLHERKRTEVDVSHILIRVSPDASPADTQEAYEEIYSIADSLDRGVPFPELAYRNSEDPSAKKKGERGYRGRLGYIQAGQLVQPFEDQMYTVPPDSISNPFRTRFGYHILKVHDRRPAKSPVRLSHIMLRRSMDSARAHTTLDSLRAEVLEEGAAFDTLARQYSDDKRSARKGGDLGKVESRQGLPASFRQAVSRLDSVGAVSDVLETKYGYHLLQLTDREQLPTFEEAYDDLKETISDQPRVDRKKSEFAHQVRSKEGTTVDTTRILGAVDASSVDSLSRGLLAIAQQNSAINTSIATLGDSTYTLDQLARHVMQTDGGAQQTIGEVLEKFLNEKAFTYASARLEERDSSFAAQMKEYREGLLVFQFMRDSVWTAAAQDSAGLRQTYQDHRDRYRYPDRVRTLAFRAPADSLLAPYRQAYPDTVDLPTLAQRGTTDSLVTLDTVMVTDQSAELYQDVLSLEDGTGTGLIDDDGEALYLIRDTVVPARSKTFDEARSSVLRDYRRQYREDVLDRLRRRYDATTYPNRLRHAFSGRDRPDSASR